MHYFVRDINIIINKYGEKDTQQTKAEHHRSA
jgi:hypothetical protein